MLKNKNILITGSSRGIGAATARLAHAYGAHVILHGKEETDQLKQLARDLNAPYIVADVTEEHRVQEAIDQLITKVERIDVLINNAGITISKPFLDFADADWEAIFKVNVMGTVHFCKALIPHMQKFGKGNIINISSIRGYDSTAGRAAYSSSKAAVKNLTSTLAKEFAPIIRVNAVAPGFTNTEMSKTWDERIWNQANSSLLKRIAEPEEIAEAILFLASDKSSFMVGQTMLVDGGYSISGK